MDLHETHRGGIQEPCEDNQQFLRQPARKGAQIPKRGIRLIKNNFRSQEADPLDILEGERQHWTEVKIMHEGMADSKSEALASNMCKLFGSTCRLKCVQMEEPKVEQNFRKQTEWSIEGLKDKFTPKKKVRRHGRMRQAQKLCASRERRRLEAVM